MIALIPSA